MRHADYIKQRTEEKGIKFNPIYTPMFFEAMVDTNFETLGSYCEELDKQFEFKNLANDIVTEFRQKRAEAYTELKKNNGDPLFYDILMPLFDAVQRMQNEEIIDIKIQTYLKTLVRKSIYEIVSECKLKQQGFYTIEALESMLTKNLNGVTYGWSKLKDLVQDMYRAIVFGLKNIQTLEYDLAEMDNYKLKKSDKNNSVNKYGLVSVNKLCGNKNYKKTFENFKNEGIKYILFCDGRHDIAIVIDHEKKVVEILHDSLTSEENSQKNMEMKKLIESLTSGSEYSVVYTDTEMKNELDNGPMNSIFVLAKRMEKDGVLKIAEKNELYDTISVDDMLEEGRVIANSIQYLSLEYDRSKIFDAKDYTVEKCDEDEIEKMINVKITNDNCWDFMNYYSCRLVPIIYKYYDNDLTKIEQLSNTIENNIIKSIEGKSPKNIMDYADRSFGSREGNLIIFGALKKALERLKNAQNKEEISAYEIEIQSLENALKKDTEIRDVLFVNDIDKFDIRGSVFDCQNNSDSYDENDNEVFGKNDALNSNKMNNLHGSTMVFFDGIEDYNVASDEKCEKAKSNKTKQDKINLSEINKQEYERVIKKKKLIREAIFENEDEYVQDSSVDMKDSKRGWNESFTKVVYDGNVRGLKDFVVLECEGIRDDEDVDIIIVTDSNGEFVEFQNNDFNVNNIRREDYDYTSIMCSKKNLLKALDNYEDIFVFNKVNAKKFQTKTENVAETIDQLVEFLPETGKIEKNGTKRKYFIYDGKWSTTISVSQVKGHYKSQYEFHDQTLIKRVEKGGLGEEYDCTNGSGETIRNGFYLLDLARVSNGRIKEITEGEYNQRLNEIKNSNKNNDKNNGYGFENFEQTLGKEFDDSDVGETDASSSNITNCSEDNTIDETIKNINNKMIRVVAHSKKGVTNNYKSSFVKDAYRKVFNTKSEADKKEEVKQFTKKWGEKYEKIKGEFKEKILKDYIDELQVNKNKELKNRYFVYMGDDIWVADYSYFEMTKTQQTMLKSNDKLKYRLSERGEDFYEVVSGDGVERDMSMDSLNALKEKGGRLREITEEEYNGAVDSNNKENQFKFFRGKVKSLKFLVEEQYNQYNKFDKENHIFEIAVLNSSDDFEFLYGTYEVFSKVLNNYDENQTIDDELIKRIDELLKFELKYQEMKKKLRQLEVNYNKLVKEHSDVRINGIKEAYEKQSLIKIKDLEYSIKQERIAVVKVELENDKKMLYDSFMVKYNECKKYNRLYETITRNIKTDMYLLKNGYKNSNVSIVEYKKRIDSVIKKIDVELKKSKRVNVYTNKIEIKVMELKVEKQKVSLNEFTNESKMNSFELKNKRLEIEKLKELNTNKYDVKLNENKLKWVEKNYDKLTGEQFGAKISELRNIFEKEKTIKVKEQEYKIKKQRMCIDKEELRKNKKSQYDEFMKKYHRLGNGQIKLSETDEALLKNGYVNQNIDFESYKKRIGGAKEKLAMV